MKLFFYRHTLEILNIDKLQHISCFDTMIKGEVDLQKLKGHLLWLLPSPADLTQLLKAVTADELHKLKSITIAAHDTKATCQFVKNQFHIIKAGGGLVEKEQQLLLIYRHGRWDLPKGKRKRKEVIKTTARREVEEECGIRVSCGTKIGTTYHAIPLRKEKYGLKKINWYHMSLIDDSQMRPQEEEYIEEVAWFDLPRAQVLLEDSYASIRYIFYLYQLHRAQTPSPPLAQK